MTTKKTAPKASVVINVRTKSGGSFRRCGITFGKEPTAVALADLDKGQAEMLQSEPMLVCEASAESKAD